MDLGTLEKFFLACLLVNTGVYVLTLVAALVMSNFIYYIHSSLFNLDKETVDKAMLNYFSNFKLLITVFNFAPWIAVVII